jgi:hypothetical protein
MILKPLGKGKEEWIAVLSEEESVAGAPGGGLRSTRRLRALSGSREPIRRLEG